MKVSAKERPRSNRRPQESRSAAEPFQILAPDGRVDKELEPSIPDDDLVKIYSTMVLNRILDDRMMMLQRQGRIGFYLTSTGEEATHVASTYALSPDDWIFPAYREPGAALLRGYDLKAYINQLYGNAEDEIKGRQMPNHFSIRSLNVVSISSPVGTQIPQAVGAAWAAKIRGDKVVALTFFGEGTASQGDFHVGLNFAGVVKAPTIFFCRNNQYAISVPGSIQTAAESIAIRALAYGIEGVRVDGNDVLAVYEVTRQARERALNGDGPTLIEGLTYRVGAHSSNDDPRRYRSDDEVKAWVQKDPIDRFRKYLESKKLWDQGEDEQLRSRYDEQIKETLLECEKVGPPPVESLFDDVYAELPWNLEEQRRYLMEGQAKGFGASGHGGGH